MPQTLPITDAYIDEIIKAQDAYNPTLNKTQGVKLRELIKLLRDKLDQPNGGVGNLLTSVTYSQLVNLVTTNSLVPGAQYLLTDYKMYWKPFIGTSDLRQADNVEPLILSAVAVNKISSSVKSTIYPNDVIHYIIGRITYDNNVIPYNENEQININYKGVVPVKGMIYRRIDENKKLDINFDYKGFWVENGNYRLPIESQLHENVSIIQHGLDMYAPNPVIIPFSFLVNTKISITLNSYNSLDQLCPAAYTDLKLTASNSEIDFYYVSFDSDNHVKPQLSITDSKLRNLFWLPSTPPNWNKVVNFNFTSDNFWYLNVNSGYEYHQEAFSVLANKNVKINVDYNFDHKQYSIVEANTKSPEFTDPYSVPLMVKYYKIES